ncbi:hypothetical protein Zm00014a_013821 [Zea mays]|uniref:Uncharacterized protein n=1 Tax=Zea mays TaxID=4577 RepID=A0A3L6E9U7_MAIZE|nr:hypothetical protein Zm00014a_013821 [Zea mays]PWZ16681.1 hypothetical protein Zm00014a_013821 [Zea mays]
MSQLKNPKTAKKGEETTVAKSEKRGQESKTNAKKKILGRSRKCAHAEPDGENRNGCSSTDADENSLAETAASDQERKVVLQELRIEVDTSRADNSNDNKENLSSAPSDEEALNNSHSENENRQLENNENVPLNENVALKVAKLQSKVHQEQPGKLKKTTNPRPFRLRTDERGVLKEAKPEKRQPFTENNSTAVLKDANRGVTKKRSTQIVTAQQLDESSSRPAVNSIQCRAVKPERVSRVASSTRRAKTASDLMAPSSRTGKKRKAATLFKTKGLWFIDTNVHFNSSSLTARDRQQFWTCRFAGLQLVFSFTSLRVTRVGEARKRALDPEFKEGGQHN